MNTEIATTLEALVARVNQLKHPDWLLFEALADAGEELGQAWADPLRWMVRGKRHRHKSMGRIMAYRWPLVAERRFVWATQKLRWTDHKSHVLPFGVWKGKWYEELDADKTAVGRTRWTAYLRACECAARWITVSGGQTEEDDV